MNGLPHLAHLAAFVDIVSPFPTEYREYDSTLPPYLVTISYYNAIIYFSTHEYIMGVSALLTLYTENEFSYITNYVIGNNYLFLFCFVFFYVTNLTKSPASKQDQTERTEIV